jgi:hypothetical protein
MGFYVLIWKFFAIFPPFFCKIGRIYFRKTYFYPNCFGKNQHFFSFFPKINK